MSSIAHTSVLLSDCTTNEHCGYNPTVMVTGGETLRNKRGCGGWGRKLYQGVPMGSTVQKWYGW